MKAKSPANRNKRSIFLAAFLGSLSAGFAATESETVTDKVETAKTELEDLLIAKSEAMSMEEISKELSALNREVQDLERAVTSKMAKLEEVRRTRVLQLRKKAEGETLRSLKLKSGKEYASTTITQVTDVGLSIRTESGTARIPAEELPKEIQDRFQFSADAAMAQIRAEQKMLAQHESEMNAETQGSFVGDPFAEAPPAAGGAVPATSTATTTPQAAPVTEKKDKGRLTARIKGYNTGIKLVEFIGHANCPARVNVYGAVQGECFFDIPANQKTEREIWVYNNYTADLVSAAGEKLDEEKQLKKTNLGRAELER